MISIRLNRDWDRSSTGICSDCGHAWFLHPCTNKITYSRKWQLRIGWWFIMLMRCRCKEES